jgi:hypothetical protein
MLDKNFQGVNIDQILVRLHDPSIEPGFEDPRNCFVRARIYKTACETDTDYV